MIWWGDLQPPRSLRFLCEYNLRASLAVHLHPLNRAAHGVAHSLEWGGMMPRKEDWCNMVEMRLAWTDTKFPPIPLIIGWNTTNELYKSTTESSTRPPSLQQNKVSKHWHYCQQHLLSALEINTLLLKEFNFIIRASGLTHGPADHKSQ